MQKSLRLTVKIPNVSNLVKKTNYDAEIFDIQAKYFAFDFNRFTGEILNAKINEKELANKSDISRFIENSDLEKKIATLARKVESKEGPNKIVKLQAFDSNYFRGKSYTEEDRTF